MSEYGELAFGRFWDGTRPEAVEDYVYGFCTPQTYNDGFFWMGDGCFEKFEQASEVPKFEGKRRRLRIDRKELASILIEGGFVPDPDGDFVNEDSFTRFPVQLWSYCGEEVDRSIDRGVGLGLYTLLGISILPEWTEEYEEENA